MSKSREILATVVEGHGVASGKSNDPRFPGGTLQMQIPFFLEFGLDLSHYHTGTLNLSIAPHRFEIISPTHTFRLVKWHPTEPAEDFSFVACRGEPTRLQGKMWWLHLLSPSRDKTGTLPAG